MARDSQTKLNNRRSKRQEELNKKKILRHPKNKNHPGPNQQKRSRGDSLYPFLNPLCRSEKVRIRNKPE